MARVKALEWTKEKPSKEGHYWTFVPAKNSLPPKIAWVGEYEEGFKAFDNFGQSGLVSKTNPNCLWYGPIHPPVEPTKGESQQ